MGVSAVCAAAAEGGVGKRKPAAEQEGEEEIRRGGEEEEAGSYNERSERDFRARTTRHRRRGACDRDG